MHAITTGYIGKHLPQFKSCLRLAAVGIVFPGALPDCLHLSRSVFVCGIRTRVCVYGGRDGALAL